MFVMFLQHCGAHVAGTDSVRDALAYLSGQRISAILIDVSTLNGRVSDFVRHVRKVPKYTNTPIIAVTGWSQSEAVRIAEANFAAFIRKPVDLDDLATTIRRLVRAA